MNESRTHLELVTDGEESLSTGSGTTPELRSRRSGWLTWALAGALIVCGIGWLLSSQHATELQTTLRATTAALLEARGQLEAYDGHLTQVKARAGDLQERASALSAELEALSGLLEAGPLAPEEASRD